MYEVEDGRKVWWPVTIKVPSDGGVLREEKIKVRFRLLTRTEQREAIAAAKKAGGNPTEEEARRDDAWLAEHITGWDDVVYQATGEPIPFTPDNLAKVLDEEHAVLAIASALWEASRGAAAKNS